MNAMFFKTIVLSFYLFNQIIFSMWENLMEELSKMEFSQEGIYIISGIVIFVVVGLIVLAIKERIERKKEAQQASHPHSPPPHHHHHHHRHHHHPGKNLKR